jgi:hypothetical protein
MKMLLFAGVIMIVLGIASLFVPIPKTESQGINAGKMHIGVQTTHKEVVSPAISAVLIVGGIAMAIAGGRSRAARG